MSTTTRTLGMIAKEIRQDWKAVNYGAVPYLDAMGTLETISDMYYEDTAKSIVAYFLGNATTWRGDKAREIKKELNSLLKGK